MPRKPTSAPLAVLKSFGTPSLTRTTLLQARDMPRKTRILRRLKPRRPLYAITRSLTVRAVLHRGQEKLGAFFLACTSSNTRCTRCKSPRRHSQTTSNQRGQRYRLDSVFGGRQQRTCSGVLSRAQRPRSMIATTLPPCGRDRSLSGCMQLGATIMFDRQRAS